MEGLQGDDGSGCLLPPPSSQEDGEASRGCMARVGSTNRAWDRDWSRSAWCPNTPGQCLGTSWWVDIY